MPAHIKHNFTLVLTGIEDITTEALDSLFDAGCDDGTLSQRAGVVYLTFTREAPSLEDAILSAIRDVRSAGLGVRRVDVCTLVTAAEIGRRIGRSRELVRQYATGRRGPGGFPPPACHIVEGNPLYLWCEVAAWLHENNMITEDVLHDAQALDVINGMLDAEHQRRLNPQLAGEVAAAVGEAAR
ncbi:MAG: hypothetical protein JO284_16685 [Planctomycetaceae bacterium]|nr:hypothetical protein [Planctomycetaceae bacterium]